MFDKYICGFIFEIRPWIQLCPFCSYLSQQVLSWVGVAGASAFACGTLLSVVTLKVWHSQRGLFRDTVPGVISFAPVTPHTLPPPLLSCDPRKWTSVHCLCGLLCLWFLAGFSKGSAYRLLVNGEWGHHIYSQQGLSDWQWPLRDGHSSCRAAVPTSTSVQDSGVYPSPSCVRSWGAKSLPLPNPPHY